MVKMFNKEYLLQYFIEVRRLESLWLELSLYSMYFVSYEVYNDLSNMYNMGSEL